MNLRSKKLLLVSFAATLLSVGHAAAFYDPGVQRWLSRDPAGETDRNLFRYCANNTLSYLDYFGRDVGTVECRGGKWATSYGGKPTTEDNCERAHEERHKQDLAALLGEDYCKNKPDGYRPNFPEDVRRKLECNAAWAEKQLAEQKSCPNDDKSKCLKDWNTYQHALGCDESQMPYKMEAVK